MLRELERYDLDHNKSIEYFNSILDGGNTLSNEVKLILSDFSTGNFFTLLPNDANFEALYEFSNGWILPQNPTHDQFDEFGMKSGSYTWIPRLDKEISRFIYEKMKLNDKYACVFEDTVGR